MGERIKEMLEVEDDENILPTIEKLKKKHTKDKKKIKKTQKALDEKVKEMGAKDDILKTLVQLWNQNAADTSEGPLSQALQDAVDIAFAKAQKLYKK